MSALAYTCPSKWGPYECGALDYWLGQVVVWVFGVIGLLVLLGYAWSWVAGRRRPWNSARSRRRWAEERRARGLAELDRRAAVRRAAVPPPIGPPPARHYGGPPQPW